MSKRMLSYYRWPALSASKTALQLAAIKAIASNVSRLETEWRFYVEVEGELDLIEVDRLAWLLAETFEPHQFGPASHFSLGENEVIEVGPRKTLVTPWSTNAQCIVENCGLTAIKRIERVCRYAVAGLDSKTRPEVEKLLFDRMTEEVYREELITFDPGISRPPTEMISVIKQGPEALKAFSQKMGLALNDQMIAYICEQYSRMARDPCDIEVYTEGQLWSEHCRHLRYNAKFVIDGVEQPFSLMEMIRDTMVDNRGNVAVAFKDNAAILDGYGVLHLVRQDPANPSFYALRYDRLSHCFKVETHNHPTAIKSYAGEATGLAVRRDIFGAGRGGIPVAHLACNYVGNLFIPGYVLPWEKQNAPHPQRLETPLQIIIGGSNGGADNANCFGNPLIAGGFTSFDQLIGQTDDQEHYAWIKTCCVAGSTGYINEFHTQKREPQAGWLVVQIGGNAYRIGLGGGSGSSQNAGDQSVALDFDSVQRADPECEQKNFSVYRACSDLGPENPIENGTDLGAGGDCVAVPELVYPAGAEIFLDELPSGDPSMARYVLFCNESQERNVVLVRPENLELFSRLCRRNRCQMKVIGRITGDGNLTLVDNSANERWQVPMDFLLADLPQLTISCQTKDRQLSPPSLPEVSVSEHLNLVLRLPKVACKSFLTDKGDMTVGGLVARNQIVGAAQLPLADCAVTVDSFDSTTGFAFAIGEQPIIGLVNTEWGVIMSITEALTNLAAARVKYENISFSATWQWPCKQPGEDARLYQAVAAANEFLRKIGLRIDVGKDSTSMSVTEDGHTTKAPGTVQMIAHADCLDVRKTLTPDIKEPGKSKLMLIDLSAGWRRLGGSALLQVYNQIGDEAPGIYNPRTPLLLIAGFKAIQHLNERGLLLSLHDRSDGGLIACVLEMAFAGICGLDLKLKQSGEVDVGVIEDLFAEEPGWVIEYLPENEPAIRAILRRFGLSYLYQVIGRPTKDNMVSVRYGSEAVLDESLNSLRSTWRSTSFWLDRQQSNPECVDDEQRIDSELPKRQYELTFRPKPTRAVYLRQKCKPQVAILREEGTNGEWELAGAFAAAGFQPVDVHLTDLIAGAASLRSVQGIGIAGGFANSDVFDAGKGLAGVMKFNERLSDELAAFLDRTDTFGFFPCNGCQAAALLGIVPWRGIESERQPRFVRNRAERFQSRPVALRVLPSDSIFLKDMAGSVLPIWVAHGEGRFHCLDSKIMKSILSLNLAPLRYASPEGVVTEDYPFNPNGSPQGIAGLSTPDGRFLAMMPHPERCFRLASEQAQCWPWKWRHLKASPWLKFFQNAKEWCDQA